MISVLPVDTPGLGDRTYLVHDGQSAIVVDPQRDYDRITALAAAASARITHVFETHLHNDYVSGGLALSREVGAEYVVGADEAVRFTRSPIRDGDVVETSPAWSLRAVHTPGHTYHHLSYVLAEDGIDVAVFTGGALLYDSTGRPDLLGPDHTDELAHAQWRSAHRLADGLSDRTAVYPTHGFGSFCAASSVSGVASTIGQEKQTNPALTQSEVEYVDQLLAGLDAFPAYYAHMGPLNAAGPTAPDLSPPRVADAAAIAARIEAGEWVVDVRDRRLFAEGHVRGTLNFGLDGSFATYVGWLIPWGTPVTLLGETPRQVAVAQRELVRIGIDRPAARATGRAQDLAGGTALSAFRRASFAELAKALAAEPPPTVLDVRRHQERERSRIDGSIGIPIHEVPARVGDLPDGEELWVHCASGYRSSIVAAILDAHGRRVVAVDDIFDNAADAGLPLAP
jgi:glyoxylase-like metal-dependent hydrolase (beta-lactamase superfamily II)/rhodanese-related sulfurtransferase